MWKYAAFVALFAVLGTSAQEEATPFTFGGRDALHGEYASDCSIDSPFNVHCMGVVVNDRHILTTASCVMNATALAHPGWLRVMCGNNHLFTASPGRHVSGVSHIYPHDGYVPATNLNDLAIIRLATPFVFPSNTIEPAIFNVRPVADGFLCEYSGWGRAATAATVMTPQKRVILAPTIARNTCNAAGMANPNRALESMMCAGQIAAGGAVTQTTCTGNIGGALYCGNQVAGILVLGTGCGATNAPGIYIQTRLFINWMNSQLTRTDTIPAGTTYPRPN